MLLPTGINRRHRVLHCPLILRLPPADVWGCRGRLLALATGIAIAGVYCYCVRLVRLLHRRLLL